MASHTLMGAISPPCMTRSECLKRSVECCRLAEAASEPEMKVYLLRLALSWMQAATSADERVLEEA